MPWQFHSDLSKDGVQDTHIYHLRRTVSHVNDKLMTQADIAKSDKPTS